MNTEQLYGNYTSFAFFPECDSVFAMLVPTAGAMRQLLDEAGLGGQEDFTDEQKRALVVNHVLLKREEGEDETEAAATRTVGGGKVSVEERRGAIGISLVFPGEEEEDEGDVLFPCRYSGDVDASQVCGNVKRNRDLKFTLQKTYLLIFNRSTFTLWTRCWDWKRTTSKRTPPPPLLPSPPSSSPA